MIHYGYIDRNLQLFGKPMNASKRYQSICKNGHATTDRAFYEKLKAERLITSIVHETETVHLKGMGLSEVVHIAYGKTI